MRRAVLLSAAVFWAFACSCGSSDDAASAGVSTGGVGNDATASGSTGRGGSSSVGGTTSAGGSDGSASTGASGGSSVSTGGANEGGSDAGSAGAETGGASTGGPGRGTSGEPEAGVADAQSTESGGNRDASTNDVRIVDARADATAASEAGPVKPATLWIAGDSTVQTYAAGNTDGNGGTELEGWGQEIGQFFTNQITVQNKAIGGRSIAFFMWSVMRDSAGNYLCVDDQGNPQYQLDSAGNKVDTSQWSQIKAGIEPGDFLLIQFGTNDETHTCPRYVSLADFETDLGIMADTVRSHGATPIFVTPMSHRSFAGTMIDNTLLPYANAMKTEASTKMVEVEDLNLRSVEYFNMVGNTFLATNIFDTGTTHFIKPGAIKMAELIVGEIRKNHGPLAAYLK